MISLNIEATKQLPEHDIALKAILEFFYEYQGIDGCFLSGSVAARTMDKNSDVDLGILFGHEVAINDAWQKRWEWNIAPWFHRFDADHIKPYFVIYFFEPDIKADIHLFLKENLPPKEGGPYEIIWDNSGDLEQWQVIQNELPFPSPDWNDAVHEDEQFWAWLFFLYSHVNRGEYYDGASEFPPIRNIVEQWIARLAGKHEFVSRKLENEVYAKKLLQNDIFPSPNRRSLKTAIINLAKLQLDLRSEIEKKYEIKWKTGQGAILKISELINDL